MSDYSKAQFISTVPIDKIALWSTAPGSFVLTAPAVPLDGHAVNVPQTNFYGKKCLPTVIWSLDNATWYPGGTELFYYNATNAQFLRQVVVTIGCKDSTYYVIANTQYTSDQTIYYKVALDSPQ